MNATGGFTHFMDGLEAAGKSVARCANLPPTGLLLQNWANCERMSSRLSCAKCCIQANQSVGQPKVSTSSRGKPKGRSKPPTQGPGVCRHSLKSCNEEKNCSCFNKTRSPTASPQAMTICLRLDGLLLKSQPSRRVMRRSPWLTWPEKPNPYEESALKTRAAESGPSETRRA